MSLEITRDVNHDTSAEQIISTSQHTDTHQSDEINSAQENVSPLPQNTTNIPPQTNTRRVARNRPSNRPQHAHHTISTPVSTTFTTDDNKDITISYTQQIAPKEGISSTTDSPYYQDELPMPLTQTVPSDADITLDGELAHDAGDEQMSTFDCYVHYDESEDYRQHSKWSLVRGKGLWAKMKYATYKTIDGLDYVGGIFASVFGLTDSEYQYAVEAAIRLEQEEQAQRDDQEQQEEEQRIQQQQQQGDLELGVIHAPSPHAEVS